MILSILEDGIIVPYDSECMELPILTISKAQNSRSLPDGNTKNGSLPFQEYRFLDPHLSESMAGAGKGNIKQKGKLRDD